MGLIKSIIILLILILIVSTATYFLTKGSVDIVVKGDPYQQKAEDLLVAAATVGWISIAFILIGGVGLIYYGGAKMAASGEAGIIVYLFLTLIILVFIVNGALAVGAAVNIKKGANFDKNKEIYNECAWIGGIFIGVTGLIIVYQIYTYFSTKAEVKKIQEDAYNTQYNKVSSAALIASNKNAPPAPVQTAPSSLSFATLQSLAALGLTSENISALTSAGVPPSTINSLAQSGISSDLLAQIIASPTAMATLATYIK